MEDEKGAPRFFIQTSLSQQTLVCLLGQFNKRFSQRSSIILTLSYDALTERQGLPSSVRAQAYLCSRADRRTHMRRERYNVSTLGQFVGQELGVSDWLTI